MLLLTIVACSWFGGDPKPATPSAGEPLGYKPDVVVITVDTTRADRIGAYGYRDGKTDTMDALAAAGIRFEHATSPLPLTIPSHATMFTGLFPFHHGIRSNGDNVLGTDFTTLAERLKDDGYATGASVAAFVTSRQWGFAQGFDAFFDQLPEKDEAPPSPEGGGGPGHNFWHDERPGDLVVDDALNWLAGQSAEKPVFLWVHLYDAHFPYIDHASQGDTFKERPYDGEIAFVDDQIGRLVEAFEGRRVLWSVIGDHGESLGEHGESTHGLYTYDATARVPWILSGAGVSPGVVREPVSSADLTPTLLRILGLPIPDGLDGKPQPGSPTVPFAESYQLAERFRLAPHRAIVDGTLKFIDLPKPELYDLATDPGERTNLAADRPAEVTRLRAVVAGLNAAPPSGSKAQLDADTVGQLAALGYVTGDSENIDYATLPDPKDFQEFLNRVNRLDFVTRKQGVEGALVELDALIAMKPDAFELRMRKLPLLARAGRNDEAKAFLEETAKLFPDKARVWVILAGTALRDNNVKLALEMAQRGVAADPRDPAAQEAEVEALFRLERADEAVKSALVYMGMNASNYGVAALLGRHYIGTRDLKNAETYLRIAVSGPNPRRAARSQLALLAIAAGARVDAYTLLEAEVKDYPGNRLARRMLARLYGEDQRWLDQKSHLEFLLRAEPTDARAMLNVAQCLFNLADYAGARKVLTDALASAPEEPDVLLLHANLLAKEGKREEGRAVFEKANAINEKRVREAEKKGAKVIVNPERAPDGSVLPGAAPTPVSPTAPVGAPK